MQTHRPMEVVPALAVVLVATAVARAELTVTADGVAVFDSVAETYWLRDLTTFDHLSYIDQLEAIASFGDGNWRMATLPDIETLDVNPDSDIHAAFLPTAQSSVKGVHVDIYFGRIDFDFGGNLHMIAHMSWNTDDDVVFSPLTYLGNGGSDDGPGPDGQGGFSAWVVYDGVYAPACEWDLDGDGDVDVIDLLWLLAAGGGDDVDIFDLLALLANWGPCP